MTRLKLQILSGMIVLVCTGGPVYALDWQALWQRPDQVAYEKLQSGDSTAAAEIFDDPQWRGVSRYRAGEFEEAQKEFSTLDGETALYNQAVTAVRQGEYENAIEKFESLLSQNADHKDAQHNLEITRELARQQQQQEQQNSDQQQQSEEQQEQEQQEQEQESQSEGEGSSSDSESDSDENSQAESNDTQSGGDLTTNPEDAAQQQSQANAEQTEEQESSQDEQAAAEQTAAEQAEIDADESRNADNTVPASTAPSESEQATEQWLRRIPDDPSQLLRNKIKLNHMIEHADVRDMREPW